MRNKSVTIGKLKSIYIVFKAIQPSSRLSSGFHITTLFSRPAIKVDLVMEKVSTQYDIISLDCIPGFSFIDN